jgi:hypothetical protein
VHSQGCYLSQCFLAADPTLFYENNNNSQGMRHSCPAFKPINECHVSKLFSKAGSTITLLTFMGPLTLGWHSLHLRALHHCKCTGGFIGAGSKQNKNESNHNLMHEASDHHQLQS